jgi:hypothetical protein
MKGFAKMAFEALVSGLVFGIPLIIAMSKVWK